MSRKETIKQLANSLLRRRQTLLSKIKQTVSSSLESQVGETGAITEALGSKFQLAESDLQELERIDGALQRHRNEELGTCKTCRKNIPLVRLRTIPHAVRCVPCQEEAESGERDEEMTSGHVALDATFLPEVLSLSHQLS